MTLFTSSLLSISKLRSRQFLIPSYQRPYVWADREIGKLLSDIWSAFGRGDTEYYLGTIVTSRDGLVEELIDGQQRFTTLWLFALAFEKRGISSDLHDFLKVGEQLRLLFAIRTEVREYLEQLLGSGSDEGAFEVPMALLDAHPYLKGIAYAAKHIYNAVPQLRLNKDEVPAPAYLSAFAGFIARQVLFVKNTAPPNADLKKLFTTLNNSGVQLDQSDILKARLLEKITANKMLYSKAWEACAFMEDYFEGNVQSSFAIASKTLRREQLSDLDRTASALSIQADETGTEAMCLADILAMPVPAETITALKDEQGREMKCGSIIDFPQFLLHTLRLYRKWKRLPDFKQPFQTGRLLEIFEPLCAAGEMDIVDFFKYLWKVRFLFDLHVVKWVDKDGDRILGLRGLNNELQRDPVADKTEQVMLQSLLYFTGNYNTQIWLTAWLQELLDGRADNQRLEEIDNALSLTATQDKEATWEWINDQPLSRDLDPGTYLRERKGTAFRHYWFFKLEYLLWKNWPGKADSHFETYRITSKNSVEHIFPRNEEFGNVLLDNEGKLFGDTFGNLTLLSVGENSGYGNQAAGKKRIDLLKKPTYPSLKLVKFFEVCGEDPDFGKVTQHEDEMIALLHRHYANTGTEPGVLSTLFPPLGIIQQI